MDQNIENDFLNAGNLIRSNPRKAAKIIWGCAKAMTLEHRKELYLRLEKEHQEECLRKSEKFRNYKGHTYKYFVDMFIEKSKNFNKTFEAKALLRFGLE